MIEMSAIVAPALAQPAAVLAAASAGLSGNGAQTQDFSALLAGAAGTAQAPALASDALMQAEMPAATLPDLAAAAPGLDGKRDAGGKAAGNFLPSGKLPAARLAASGKEPRHQGKPAAAIDDEAVPSAPAVQEPGLAEPIAAVTTAAVAQAMTPTTTLLAPAAPMVTASAPQDAAVPAAPPKAPGRAATLPTNIAAASAPTDQTARPPVHDAVVAQATTASHQVRTVAASVKSRAVAPTVPSTAKRQALAEIDPSDEPIATKPAAAPTASKRVTGSTSSAKIGDGADLSTTMGDAVRPNTGSSLGSSSKVTLLTTRLPSAALSVATTPALPHAIDLTQTALPTVTIGANAAPAPAANRGGFAPVSASIAAALAAQPATLLATAQVLPTAGRDAAGPTSETLRGPSSIATPVPAVLPDAALSALPTTSPIISLATPLATAALGATALAPVSGQGERTVATVTVAAALLAQPPALADAASSTAPAQATVALVQLPNAVAPGIPLAADAAPLASTAAVSSGSLASDNAIAAAAPQTQSLRDHAAVEPRAAVVPASEPAASKPSHAAPLTAADAPVAFPRTEALVTAAPVDLRSAPVIAPTVTTAAAATTPTQDIAALVDRITEARAATAPHTIRAALVHEDFGSVSLNFRSDASHIHVTLGSADPGFAPAVQAAAAASLAGNGASDGTGDDNNARRDASVPQPSAQQQDAAARNDASPQQHSARERAQTAERQPAREPSSRRSRDTTDDAATASTPQRRGGIYA